MILFPEHIADGIKGDFPKCSKCGNVLTEVRWVYKRESSGFRSYTTVPIVNDEPVIQKRDFELLVFLCPKCANHLSFNPRYV